MNKTLVAGASAVDITPLDPQFLFGYVHTERISEGVHDPLLSSALFLEDGRKQVLFVANDVIFVSKETARRARQRIHALTGTPEESILISATHTHSGPVTVDYLSSESDPTVPKASPEYLQRLEDGIVAAAEAACQNARPAEVGLGLANGNGLGTNRRDPSGPADPQVPVFLARDARSRELIACMLVVSMHPTVLHEDSRLVSGDFPGMTRKFLQENILGAGCPVLYHTGPAGNQSPRHVTLANTFDEAERLGERLGRAVAQALPGIEYISALDLGSDMRLVDLPRKAFPPLEQAQVMLHEAVEKLERLRKGGASRREVRTAEVDWFGAEETVALSRAQLEGRLKEFARRCMPAEVQVLKVGKWSFVGWPGEVFVEYALEVKRRCPDTFVISLANGELQGYIVTEEAAREGGYEASNGLFAPQAGQILVETTVEIMRNSRRF
jgi:neutral ceramidase